MDLRRFGFTSTESRVYLALLKVSPATGYTVAREAGMARANAYGALERLAARGVAARLPGRPARYVAADPASLTGKLDREWRRDLDSLTQQLAALERRDARPSPLQHEVLSNRSTLQDRLVTCARGAGEELLGVVGPWAADCFAEIGGTRRTRATVRILSLGVPAPDGALVHPASPREIAAYWGGLPVALVSDRRLAVLGLFFDGDLASGLVTNHEAVVPFIRHLLRRELAAATPQRVS